MIYELRVYRVVQGRMAALLKDLDSSERICARLVPARKTSGKITRKIGIFSGSAVFALAMGFLLPEHFEGRTRGVWPAAASCLAIAFGTRR